MRILSFLLMAVAAPGAAFDVKALEEELARIPLDGRLGACVGVDGQLACVRGDERFSLQSVMKLFTGVAVLDAVERRGWRLDDKVLIRRQDLGFGHQPIAERVGPEGFETTVGDLVRRSIIDSDNAAVDILAARLGGMKAVQEMLDRKGVRGIRLDRMERDLQTEIIGLRWRPEFADTAVFDAAVRAVPESTRTRAYAAYQKDVRDTATPRSMAGFLLRLHSGKLLTPKSTAFILQAMAECATGADRLTAGLQPGWKLKHKTGSSGSWQGLTVATNDAGLLESPDGRTLAIVGFVGDSRASAEARAAAIAKVAAAAIQLTARPR